MKPQIPLNSLRQKKQLPVLFYRREPPSLDRDNAKISPEMGPYKLCLPLMQPFPTFIHCLQPSELGLGTAQGGKTVPALGGNVTKESQDLANMYSHDPGVHM